MPATANTPAEPKPTPGPWRYGVRSDGTIWLSIGDPVAGPHFQGDLVASEADARLIVAARDLLDALESAVTAMEVLEHPEDWGALAKARAAITKAKSGAAS